MWAVLLKKKSWEFSVGPVVRTLCFSMVGKLRSYKLQCIAKKREEEKKAQWYRWNSGTKAKLQWVKQSIEDEEMEAVDTDFPFKKLQ